MYGMDQLNILNMATIQNKIIAEYSISPSSVLVDQEDNNWYLCQLKQYEGQVLFYSNPVNRFKMAAI